MFVITLIANPQKERLTATLADSIAHALSMQDVAIEKRVWLKEGVALDIYITSPLMGEVAERSDAGEGVGSSTPLPNPPPQGGREFLERLDSIAQDAIRGTAFDAIVQPLAHRKKKLLIADMESTIITCECLDELAGLLNRREKIAAITQAAMNGEIDFESALKERVACLKGMTESALQKVMDEKVRLMPGACELVAAMKKNGAYTMLVSGGFDFFADKVKGMLGFDEARSNRLEIKDGMLTGNVIAPILGKEAKLQALKEACRKLNISSEEVLAVGDGANDLPMLLEAGLGVAYHAKPTVRAQAKAKINHTDLSALVYAQGY